MKAAVAGSGPFPIRLAGITGSEGEYLLLNVKRGNDAIVELHDRLYAGPLRRHLSREHTFTPHVTVGRLSTQAAFRSALDEATALDVDISTVAAAVSVYRDGGNGSRPHEFEVGLSTGR